MSATMTTVAIVQLLVDNPDGMTAPEMAGHLGVTPEYVKEQISQVRRILAETGKDFNVTADRPTSGNGPHTYRLVRDKDGVRPWGRERIEDAKTRLVTIQAVCHVVVETASHGSMEYRDAVVMERHLQRLLEDLADVHTEITS